MHDLPPGLETDLAVLELTGSTIEAYGAHLLIRTVDNPDFHRGNRLVVVDEDAVADAERWVETFRSAFPETTWIGIGLIRIPDDQNAWVAQGLAVELVDVLSTCTLPRQTPLATSEEHRRRGLASHLLAVAARWAGDRGCDRWVIVTEATNPAGRLYRRVGFEPDTRHAEVYRKDTR